MVYLNKFGYQQRFSSLKKQPPLFRTEQGPRRFFDAIRDDDKIDLLRIPLILAMAVSLYAETPELIPSTIGKLYQEMVEEMLDRHSFRAVPDEADRGSGSRIRGRTAQRRHNTQSRYSLNEYQAIDKYSLLRQFALEAAKQTGAFGDFTRQNLEKFAAKRADSLNMAGQPEAFVEEIITHSGLLTGAGRDDNWHYAHRSIQEFLGAQELRLDNDAGFLLDRADSLDWRQAIQFYAVGQESQQIDAFLRALANRNPELAVRCLQACRPSVPAAQEVLDHLRPNTREAVTALAAATRCPLEAVRTLAIASLKEAILDPEGVFNDANLELEELLPLLVSLTRTNAADIAAVLPMVMDRAPDDPRLVRPLWQCLSADGIEDPEHVEACAQVIRRLLTLVTTPEAFDQMAGEDPHDKGFLADLRPQAYPFRRALPPEHNLVTLLEWAEYLKVAPAELNRFFAAKAANRLRTVEADRRRTISVSLCWPGRVLSGLLLIAAMVTTIVVLATHPGLTLRPFGWWTLALVFGVGAVPAVLSYNYAIKSKFESDPWFSWDGDNDGNALGAVANANEFFSDMIEAAVIVTFGVVAASFALAPIPLAGSSLAGYIAVSVGAQLTFWGTGIKLFDLDQHYYLRRPNEFVDMYDDKASRHWVARPKEY
jgi:hypothetical protein